MADSINTNEQMIRRINDVLSSKSDAVINIVNDKLTLSVFSLLEQNLSNVKEINFVIRDARFLPHQSEISHEFEINPKFDWVNSYYDFIEKFGVKDSEEVLIETIGPHDSSEVMKEYVNQISEEMK